ncbi:MAG: hypothetical protein LBQ55_01980 [Treponema sp.]|nr:hypothetical protein [Treponema sp.]
MTNIAERNVDVLVIGACTAGLYFAGLMAGQGYRTLVCDTVPEEEQGNQYHIIHLGRPGLSAHAESRS